MINTNYGIPVVVENDGRTERSFDLYSRLLRDRIIFVHGQVEDGMADTIVGQLLLLEAENPGEPITMYINSPGGSVTAGLAIRDTMDYITSPVHTVCMGMAASMGAYLLSAGAKRFALKRSTIMIHQVLGGAQGQVSDMEIRVAFSKRLKELLTKDLADSTKGKVSLEDMEIACDRDNFLTAEQALEMGLIDEIIMRIEDMPKED